MLQKLDTEHLNRLALAEALASMEPRDFDMRRPDRCICGHALRLFGTRTPYFGGWESQLRRRCKLARSFFRSSAGVIRASQSCESTTTPTPIRRMQHEWCAISRPPIPLIGASLASFSRSLHSLMLA